MTTASNNLPAMSGKRFARVVVVGTSGSGKTTFARALAKRLAAPHVELDALHWLPGWTARDPSAFRTMVDDASSGARWVIDGNYSLTQDMLWSRASAIVWLDYAFALTLWRSLKRTLSRVITGETVCGDNRETWRIAFFSRRSILLWVTRTFPERRRRYGALFAQNAYPDAAKIHLKRPAQASSFLASITPT